MKVVKVYGALKKRLGGIGRFEFEAQNPAQAIKALCANFPGLEKWLIDSEQDGIGYKVTIGKEVVGEDNFETLAMPWSEKDVFKIVPVMTGSGKGFGRILLGAALITAAVVFAPAAAAGGGFLTAGAAGTTMGAVGIATQIAGSIGISMVLGGISQMISPTPQNSLGQSKEAARLQNYNFSGITNTSQQGMPVPIAYGRVFCGSAVISSGLDVDQV
jgi:predicted phage tail protein